MKDHLIVKDGQKSVDFALALGVGYEISKSLWILTVRYNLGLSSTR